MPQDIALKRSSKPPLQRTLSNKYRRSAPTKYQVFVSSTFKDLIEERQAVSRAILELNHIPAGMELFPAFDQSQLEFIKRIIDDCDYYLIILGGKYGSLTEDGISFTEAEYNYALEQEKPVIALIHEDIDSLPRKDVEKDSELLEKLMAFRKRLGDGRLVKFWKDINDLKSNAIISLTSSFDKNPQTGWRRDQGEPSEELLARFNATRDQLERYRERVFQFGKRLSDYEEVDSAEVDIKYRTSAGVSLTTISANDLIKEFAAPLKNGFDRAKAKDRLDSFLIHTFEDQSAEAQGEAIDNAILFFEVFEIAEKNETGHYVISEEKLHLLKAAFKKRASNNSSYNDEVPF